MPYRPSILPNTKAWLASQTDVPVQSTLRGGFGHLDSSVKFLVQSGLARISTETPHHLGKAVEKIHRGGLLILW